VAVTLILGIVPGRVLSMARSAAQTFPILSSQQTPVTVPGSAVMAQLHKKTR
jgi:hypothetical protein